MVNKSKAQNPNINLRSPSRRFLLPWERSMMMMMSDLPSDLLVEILSRVPTTTLLTLRPTCKRWNALFKNQEFTEKHFRNAAKQSMLLMLKELRVCPMSVDLNADPPSMEFKDALSLKGSYSNSQQEVDIDEVFHCGGLLLCTTKYNKLVVWNPCLGETRWIEAKAPRYKKHSKFALGYQNNDKSCHSFKILRYWHNLDTKHPLFEIEIYELSSGSWRVFDGISPDFFIHRHNGVSLKGNTYWIASSKEYGSTFLLSFDFTTERFRRLSLPTTFATTFGTSALSLVREEKLSVLRNCYFIKMELWVSNNETDTEAALLWSKSFTVDVHLPSIPLSLFPFFATFLLDEEKKLAVCCESSSWNSRNIVYIFGEDEEHYTEIPYLKSTDRSWRPNIFNYVPSLVQIQQGGGKTEE